jgi:nitroimidazol reductase NimA-like FMN-containing flavoprotein (pyridoxamine 5'-phosphate oxidase superfamily)
MPVKRRTLKSSDSKDEPKADRPFAPGYGIMGAKEGKGLLPWSWVVKKMKGCRTFWLATVHANAARPHAMPLWGVWLDDAFYFSTGRTSRKGQNLAANPACTVMNDDGEEAVIVEGAAAEVRDPSTLKRMAAAYKKKYGWDISKMEEPVFAVRPSRVFGLVEKTFPQSATRWRF